MSKTILALSDTHFPWVYKKGLEEIIRACRYFHPDYVVHCGDLYDFYSYGRFARTQDLLTPSEEIKRGREAAWFMWQRIKESVPEAKLYQVKGNHDERPISRILTKEPALLSLCNLDKMFQFDGVKTMDTERDELIIEKNIVFMHGYKPRLGDHVRHNLMNTVCGHTHKGGMFALPKKYGTLWELNVGWVGDRKKVPFSYTKQRQFSTWTPGFGIIDRWGPRFIPL